MRTCMDCDFSIEDRHFNAVRCEDCAEEARLATWRRYYERNKVHISRRNKEWQSRNKDLRNSRQRSRYHNDPQFRKTKLSRNKDRIDRLGGQGYRRNLPHLLEDYGGKCGICGQHLPENKSLIHVDHIIPVSKGGADDYENLQPAHAVCNLRKGNRAPERGMRNRHIT